MKKKFNHTKRPVNDWDESQSDDFSWEDEEDIGRGSNPSASEELSQDAYYEGEYEGEYDGGEYEYAEGGEYSEEGAAEGEYYEDRTTADGYYAEGAAADGYYESRGTEASGESYEEQPASDGYYEGGYAEGADDGYYEEESGDYYGDGEGFEGEITYIDEDNYAAEYVEPQKAAPLRNRKKKNKISVMDMIIALTGIIVVCLLLVTAKMYMNSNAVDKQVSEFANVGAQLDGIGLIGEKGLIAVADAKVAKLAAASLVEEEASREEDEFGYDENEYTRQVSVTLNMTSIQKDLKIKFINENSKKLVANVPFSVTVEDPNGKTSIWSDDDMDGIIYKKDITPGKYKVTMEALTDSRYSNYTVLSMTRTIDVKKDIEYKKVDVADEIKAESEVDAKKEDTSKKDTSTESSLQDTVAWVDSKAMISTYTEIPKNTIIDPMLLLQMPQQTALNTAFLRITATGTYEIGPANPSVKKGETLKLELTPKITCDADETIKNITLENVVWASEKTDIATVDANGVVTGVAKGETVISLKADAKVTIEKADTPESTEPEPTTPPEGSTNPENPENPGNPESPAPSENSGTPSEGSPEPPAETSVQSERQETVPVSISCKVQVVEAMLPIKISVEKKETVIPLEKTTDMKVTLDEASAGYELEYKVSSDKPDVVFAKIAENADKKGAVISFVTGKNTGDAKITLTVDYKKDPADTTTAASATKAEIVISVKAGSANKITFAKEKNEIYAEVKEEKNITIYAFTETKIASTATVSVKSSDETVLKATAKFDADSNKITITTDPLKAGSATLTITLKEGDLESTQNAVITVLENPKKDNKTELLDSNKQNIYVLENDTYRKATYADYYTYSKFYVKGQEKYTGWQTINGKVYFFDADGKKVVGEQVIQGAKYTFAADGSLVVGNGILGIDVSKWNGTIDWSAVKNSGINYVIIRCGYRGSTQGALIADPKFTTNIKGATNAGLKVGVYFFSQAVDEREAVEEASMVIEQIKNYKISYPVFLDVEPSGGRGDGINKDQRTAVCKAFCQTIQNAGYTAGIYANKSWLETKLDPSALSAYKIWLAQYAAAPSYTGRYDLWQYRATGKVTGISGNVDLNLSYMGY